MGRGSPGQRLWEKKSEVEVPADMGETDGQELGEKYTCLCGGITVPGLV